MSLLDRVLGRQSVYGGFGTEIQYTAQGGTSFIDNLIHASSTNSSVRVTEHSALGMAAVWRSVNLISSGGASLPLHAYKPVPVLGRDQPSREMQTEGQAADLLRKPHPDLTPFEFWEIVYAHLLLWGNAYCLKITDAAGEVTELWPIHPSRIAVGRASDGKKVYRLDGGTDSFGDDRIWHVPGFGYDGIAGLAPISLARQGIGLALAAETFGARLFGSGSLAGGILTTEQRLKPDQAESLKKQWKAKIAGLDKAHDVAVLDAGAKFQQLTIPPEDAQFIESRGFQIEEVARIFGIPPHMLMSTEKSTSWGTGIEQQSLGFVTYTLRPWLTRVEQRIGTLFADPDIYARFAIEGLLRGDSQQRAAYYKTLRELGALSPNEIRALEELPPVAGGDSYMAPMNFAPLPGSPDAATAEGATG